MNLGFQRFFRRRGQSDAVQEAQLTGLWIDDPELLADGLGHVDPDIRPYVESFANNGYVIFERLIPDDVIDKILEDTDRALNVPQDYVIRNAGKYVDPASLSKLGQGDRVIDLYGVSAAARSAALHPLLCQFLGTVFGDPPIAMQSLSFTYGSQQQVHQDTAYVISQKPLHLAASWIALEDVVPGSGELIYYPGSQRFDHYLFNGVQKGWVQSIHGQEEHHAYLDQLHTQAKARGIALEHFHARRGDVLIWHADLAHGGARMEGPRKTRRSFVVHYCPFNVKPKYRDRVASQYHEYPVVENGEAVGYFASRHYQLKMLERGERASIYFDGGVSQ